MFPLLLGCLAKDLSDDVGAGPADTADSETDTSGDSGQETGDTSGPHAFPTLVALEVIAESPTGNTTPPSWNANLPKMVGDVDYLYALHTAFPDDYDDRYSALMARPRAGGEWAEIARFTYIHQHPGMVMDAAGNVHVAFVCQQANGSDQTCFPGGASSQGHLRRFYHLVFSARTPDHLLRTDTYANVNEWPGETNGYLGLGTVPTGETWWSLADDSWERVVQWWGSETEYGTTDTLSDSPNYLLYPVHAADETGAVAILAGEFDPGGTGNAAYAGFVRYDGDLSAIALSKRVQPTGTAGTLAAFPDDATIDYSLAYVDDGACDTALYAGSVESRLGCIGTYAKLVVGTDALWLVSPGASLGELRLGRSVDSGLTWEWAKVPIAGLNVEDIAITGLALVRPDTSPALYDPDVIRFFAAGLTAESKSVRSYYGEISLAE